MLAADFLHLEKDVELVNRYADLFHLDVMDGVFVPNISYGFPIVEAIAKKATKPLDVHLMIVEPEKYVERFAKVGAEMISFHVNATKDPAAVLDQIHAAGAKAGLVINPDLPVTSISAPASESAFEFAAETPPSTSIGISSPCLWISAFRTRTRSYVSSMNFCPPNPANTDISITKSHFSR